MNNYHHHVTLLAWISLTLSCHLSLSSIAPRRSSRLYPVSAQSCCIEVLASHPAFACPCEGVHRSMSLMSSSLLRQQCPTCLVHLTRIVFIMGGRWPYSCRFVGCCLQDLFNIAHSMLVQSLSSFFFIRLVSIHVLHLYSSIDTTAVWKKLFYFISQVWLPYDR